MAGTHRVRSSSSILWPSQCDGIWGSHTCAHWCRRVHVCAQLGHGACQSLHSVSVMGSFRNSRSVSSRLSMVVLACGHKLGSRGTLVKTQSAPTNLWPCAEYLTSLALSFIIHRMGMIKPVYLKGLLWDINGLINPCKPLRLVFGMQFCSPKVLTSMVGTTTTVSHTP